ncbi:MAG: substrate-binding domain-containing protein, partial [Pseudomonadota bacterium]
GKMLHFVPLCFTKYVVVTPKGNPAGIKGIQDLGKPGVKTVLVPNASPPGGEASTIILKKAGVLEQAQRNAVKVGDCVQSVVPDVIERTGDAAVMELRLTKKAQFAGMMEVIEIPEEFIPPRPVTFVIGVMKFAHNKDLAEDYVKFITSEKGRSFFEAAGFIPARSEEGERLIRKYGVKDA